MGFDNHMIAGNRACSTFTPIRQNRTMPRPWGFYAYELVACSNAWSNFAVEAALKLRLGAHEKTPFGRLVKPGSTEDPLMLTP
jgi:hypothetical protein